MVAIALVLLVPTVAVAWWSRVVARRVPGVSWVLPVVLGAWLATTVLAVVMLVSRFDAASTVGASERSAFLATGIGHAVDVFVALLVVLVGCAAFTAYASRRRGV